MRNAPVYPELVSGRDDGFVARRWRIERGSTRRGEASCDMQLRVLEVPMGADPTSRVVRAHELMHARVSPHDLFLGVLTDALGDVAPFALECAEEFRVNTLLARLGFDVALLRDGSEKTGGRRIAENDDWAQALCFLLAVLGTGAERDYLAGVRAARPTWMVPLRALRRRALAVVADCDTTRLGATTRNGDGVPAGYAACTLVIARLLTRSMAAKVPETDAAVRQFRRSLEPGGRRAPSGRFAALVFDETSRSLAEARTRTHPRSRGASTGTILRYPGRLLTDERRRAFGARSRDRGGIVVIDQSGSMDIDDEELARLMCRAPRAVIIGYSHRPGDRGETANVWVLADRHGVVARAHAGNVGNGVDGPVLRWATEHRVGREPVIWVTDGQVTDSNDHPDEALTDECARLVLKHGVTLVGSLAEVRTRLQRPQQHRAELGHFGRVGRKACEISTSGL